jgi:5-hydroxyisourate hydrolase-like protein (transthyretin family)
MAITTHVLDTALGKPAANVGVTLEQLDNYDQIRVIAKLARTWTVACAS